MYKSCLSVTVTRKFRITQVDVRKAADLLLLFSKL